MSKLTVRLLLCAMVTGPVPLAMACGYDAIYPNPFEQSWPGSLDVAMATAAARAGGSARATSATIPGAPARPVAAAANAGGTATPRSRYPPPQVRIYYLSPSVIAAR